MYNYVNACYEGSKQITVRTEDFLVNVVAVVYWNGTQTQTNLQSSAWGFLSMCDLLVKNTHQGALHNTTCTHLRVKVEFEKAFGQG